MILERLRKGQVSGSMLFIGWLLFSFVAYAGQADLHLLFDGTVRYWHPGPRLAMGALFAFIPAFFCGLAIPLAMNERPVLLGALYGILCSGGQAVFAVLHRRHGAFQFNDLLPAVAGAAAFLLGSLVMLSILDGEQRREEVLKAWERALLGVSLVLLVLLFAFGPWEGALLIELAVKRHPEIFRGMLVTAGVVIAVALLSKLIARMSKGAAPGTVPFAVRLKICSYVWLLVSAGPCLVSMSTAPLIVFLCVFPLGLLRVIGFPYFNPGSRVLGWCIWVGYTLVCLVARSRRDFIALIVGLLALIVLNSIGCHHLLKETGRAVF